MRFLPLLFIFASVCAFASERTLQSEPSIATRQKTFGLYGLAKASFVNAELKAHGLEAVQVAPGQALTVLVFGDFGKYSYVKAGGSDYPHLSAGLATLVRKPGTNLPPLYYYIKYFVDSPAAEQFWKDLGFTDLNGSVEMHLPAGKLAKTASVSRTGELFSLKMGATELKELTLEDGSFTMQIVSPLSNGTQYVYALLNDAFFVSRPFDPARDSFSYGKGTYFEKYLVGSGFMPTKWALYENAESVVMSPSHEFKQ